jgi:hypothetical protein
VLLPSQQGNPLIWWQDLVPLPRTWCARAKACSPRQGFRSPRDTTAEIETLKAENPDWLEREQAIQIKVRQEELRLKQQRAKA